MIHCRHAHPYGESYCTACQEDKARADERQRILNIINKHFESQQSRDVRVMLATLREELR